MSSYNLGEVVRPSLIDDTPCFIEVDGGAGSSRIWSRSEFEQAISSRASSIAAMALPSSSRIGIVGRNGAAFAQTYFAIMRAGHVAVPMNWRLPGTMIADICRDCELAVAFAHPDLTGLLPSGTPLHPLAGEVNSNDFASVEVAPEQPAKILYTSGSNGRPKGVVLSHGGQRRAIELLLSARHAEDRIMASGPFYHKNGLFNLTMGLAEGTCVVTMATFDAGLFLESIAHHRIVALSGVPTMFVLMMHETERLRNLDLSSVRRITIGSAPLTEALHARVRAAFPGATIRNGYGTTEAGPLVFDDHPQGLPTPPISLGYPHPAVTWRLVGDGNQGVFQLRSPALMSGYLNQPQLTEAKMPDGWYDTGDIMRQDSDGFFYFVSRSDDMFVSGGENVYPSAVEALLEEHPDILEAVVVPAPDEIKGQIPIAFVVPRAGTMLIEAEVKNYAISRGPAFSHPRAVVVRDTLPLAATHKVDRKSLMEEALQIAAGRRTRT
jgi:acyl-CoA synthetase (AMP-forming)/AMP-acid ligase II